MRQHLVRLLRRGGRLQHADPMGLGALLAVRPGLAGENDAGHRWALRPKCGTLHPLA